MTSRKGQAIRILSAVAVAAIAVAAATAAPVLADKGFSAADLMSMARVSSPAVSPVGDQVAYELRTNDLEGDVVQRDLWRVAVDGASAPRRLTTHAAADIHPVWAPDGRHLYFLSNRSGSFQVWRLAVDGGEAEQVTDLPLDLANLRLSPDGAHLAFSAEVFVDCETLRCTAERLQAVAAQKTSGRLYERLFVRHWDTWKDGRRAHLFVMPSAGGEPVDLTRGLDADVPSKPFGDSSDYAFTGDGKAVVFAARVASVGEPWSTDFNLYLAPVDGSAAPRRLTANPAWDAHPLFSPDGRMLVYQAMSRPGFEADRFRLVVRDWQSGAERFIAESWDRSPSDMVFSADGKTLYVTATDRGRTPLFAIAIDSGAVREVTAGGRVRSPSLAGQQLIFGREHFQSPVELFARDLASGEERQLTAHNRERLAAVAMGAAEQLTFRGWNDEEVHAWLVKPADFDSSRKAPLAFLIHGGPQGSFQNSFHYRWNPQTYAGAGYAALMIDFHGSTGYGQAFTDSISGDWGGKPLEDLQKGLAAVLERHPWIDGERVCALGASYGGYMINWIAGQWPDRFRCLVNHDGVFDLRSMYFTTEELWFPEWEFGGVLWQRQEAYERHNPARHVDRWQTPMLVIHGALDYRVPEGQGLAAFTALQRRGIPSQLLHFPDENHWVLKPVNSIQWHDTVLAWLDRWAKE